jgi:uncharacterized protein with HEPN domain
MSMKNDRTYLIHIRDAIETIYGYLHNVSYESFNSNKMIIDAVVRELEIIGEASNNLSEQFRQNHSEIQWRRMKNMRNFLIHVYFGVNTKVVWDTCKNDLPILKDSIESWINTDLS